VRLRGNLVHINVHAGFQFYNVWFDGFRIQRSELLRRDSGLRFWVLGARPAVRLRGNLVNVREGRAPHEPARKMNRPSTYDVGRHFDLMFGQSSCKAQCVAHEER